MPCTVSPRGHKGADMYVRKNMNEHVVVIATATAATNGPRERGNTTGQVDGSLLLLLLLLLLPCSVQRSHNAEATSAIRRLTSNRNVRTGFKLSVSKCVSLLF